jgi:hypothetical protein
MGIPKGYVPFASLRITTERFLDMETFELPEKD